jgi:hypothetical protein
MRVERWDLSVEMKFPATATGVPVEGERVFRWVFIAQHTWDNADRKLENIFIVPTRFAGGKNGPGDDLIGIADPIEGVGDIVAVRLLRPIEIPDGVEMPPLEWRYVPHQDDITVHYGYGPWRNNVLRFMWGRVTRMEQDENYKGSTVLSRMDNGMLERGDSGGPVHVNGRIVGVNTAFRPYEPDKPVLWAPLHQEVKLRRQLESHPYGVKTTTKDGGIKAEYMIYGEF